MPDDDRGSAGGAGENQNAAQAIKVGEKTYTAEDVQSLLASQGKATQALQQLSAVQQAAQRYGLDPESFVRQAEGSFAAVSDLIDKGLIDEHGNVVLKGQNQGSGPEPDPLEALLGGEPQQRPAAQQELQGPNRALLQALKEIRGFTGNLKDEVEQLKKDNAALLRYNLATKLKGSFPDLEDEDVNLVLERARGDRTKSLADHAKLVLGKRQEREHAAQLKLAQELGIEDLEAHLNKLKQQKSGGGAAALFTGKKLALRRNNPKDKETVTAREATQAYFDEAFR